MDSDIYIVGREVIRAALVICALLAIVSFPILQTRILRKIRKNSSIFSPILFLRALKTPELYLFTLSVFVGVVCVLVLKFLELEE